MPKRKTGEQEAESQTQWSFRPDDDVRAAVAAMYGDVVNRSRLLNEALRGRVAATALALAEQDHALQAERIKQLQRLAAKEAMAREEAITGTGAGASSAPNPKTFARSELLRAREQVQRKQDHER